MNIVVKVGVALTLVMNASLVAALSPHKSPNDDRQYQAYTLKNKLQVLLVSDEDSTKAAAALDVNVGSGADPVDRQGLAHFLEHMLFLGTEKYQRSGEYQEFISAHGGGHNAYTSYDHTNYFFDIDAQYLEPALDRFAQFFTAPLFNEEFVGREINAVESEYRAKLKEDSRRSLDVFKSVINQKHPFAKLSVGNVQTLLNDPKLKPADVLEGGPEHAAQFSQLREQLLAFYDEHYSAQRMTLVVVGPQSLKQLRQWVAQRFNSIPSGRAAKRGQKGKKQAQPLFAPGFLPRRVAIQPETDTRSLSLTFPIPAIKPHYLSKPDQYLGNIIGHEGKGSLLSYLKAQGWAEGLSAGAGLEHESGATFNVSISLTEAGLQHQQEIVAAVFQQIQKIRDTGIERWRQDEQKNILATAFRFQEQGRAIGYASHLANKLHEYPARDVLRGDYLLSQYKPALIKQLLDHLRPGNALITTMAPGLKHQQQSHWYATPYTVAEVSANAMAAWTKPAPIGELQLPSANPFIAEDLKLLAGEPGSESGIPLNISRANSSTDGGAEGTELWWTPEPQFAVPKAQLFFNIRTSIAGGSAENAALSEMLAVAVSDALNEYSYPALLAGINFQVRRHLHGLSIRVGGYSGKQGLLLSKIAQVLNLDGLTEQRVNDLHAEMLRRWGNDKKRLPYQQLFSALNNSLVSDVWSAEQKASALPRLTVAQLRDYGKRFLSSSSMQALAVGNVSKQQAHDRAAILESAISCAQPKPCSTSPTLVQRLPADRTIAEALKIDHSDSALIHYYQARDKTALSRAKMAMTAQLLKAAYFQQLRTQQQLGYIVFATASPLLDVPGFSLIVQSPGHSIAQIAAANTKFLASQATPMASEKTSNYQQNKEALLSELREKPKNLAEQAEYYWSDLALGYEKFSRRQELIAAVDNLNFNEWKTFFDGSLNHGLMIWSQGDRELGSSPLRQLISQGTTSSFGAEPFTVGGQPK